MDWDLKMPWDLAELDANPAQNVGSMVGPSSRIQGLDCSVDLKLGGLGDFCVADKCKDQQTVPGSSISPSGSSKRARAPSNATQNACCLVDGCKSDLSVCREYHRRHKVCEVHSKTPIVLVGGQEQRFCQQCSRFHFLVEFDEVKRSCRKRLDGHNRRRRKPQPESITSSSLFANHQGNRFSSYPQIYTSATSETTWPLIVKSEEDPPLYSHPHPHPHPPMHFLDHRTHVHFSNSFPRTFKENKYFPFSQQNSDHRAPTLEPERLLKTISSVNSSNSGGGNNNNDNKIFLDSDCALSLLSSTPQTSTLNLGQIVPSSDRIPMGQLLLSYGDGLGLGRYPGPGPHHVSSTGFTCSGLEDENVGSTVLVSDVSGNEMSCHGFFGEGSSDGGSQALPFSWQ